MKTVKPWLTLITALTLLLTQVPALWAMDTSDEDSRKKEVSSTFKVSSSYENQNDKNNDNNVNNNNDSPGVTNSLSSPSIPIIKIVRKPLSSPQDVWILSLDGGGIRGNISAQVLHSLEDLIGIELKKRLRQKIESLIEGPLDPQLHIPLVPPLAKLFDIMAGTSTGGIIALGLSLPDPSNPTLPKYTVSTLVDLYKEKGNVVFSPTERKGFLGSLFSSKFRPQGLESLLKSYFGEVSLKDSLNHLLVTAYEMRQERLVVFDSEKAKSSLKENFLFRDVARGTSAAPTFFNAASFKNLAGEEHLFADGGIIANNPAMIAYARAKELFPEAQNIYLLSLGTGECLKGNLSEIGGKGLLGWGSVIADIMISGASDHTHQLLKNFQNSKSLTYFRLQPQLTMKQSELDNVTVDNLHYLVAAGKTLVQNHKKDLHFIAIKLADRYEAQGYHLYPLEIKKIKSFLKESQLPSSLSLKGMALGNLLLVWDISQVLQTSYSSTLTELDLTGTGLEDNGLKIIAKSLPTLTSLHLGSNKLGSQNGGEKAFAALTQLKHLDLSKNMIRKDWIKAIAIHLPSLSALNLSSTDLGDEDITLLGAHLLSLKELYVDRTPLTYEGGKTITEKFPQLQKLFLAYNTETLKEGAKKNVSSKSLRPSLPKDAALGVIDYIGAPTSLKSLDLAHNDLEDAAIIKLTTFLKSPLEELTLRYNLIGEKGAKSLASFLHQNTTLKILNIGNNKIGSEGGQALAQALQKNTTLTNLDMKRNHIDEGGMKAILSDIEKNKGLQSIGLESNIVSPSLEDSNNNHNNQAKGIEEALSKLQKQRPKLQVKL